jgi:hypothetical protein
MAVTTWNTAPDYDEWGPDKSWGCEDWIQWHKLLKLKFGAVKANYIWNYSYAQGTQGASHWSCRTTNNMFRNYVAKEGLNPYESAGAFAPILNVIGGAGDVVSGTGDLLSDIGKNLKIIGYIAVLGVAVYVGITVYKNTK